MSFELTTERLILKIEDSNKTQDILAFYQNNKALFEQFEPTRPNNFYTEAYQRASVSYEYSEIITRLKAAMRRGEKLEQLLALSRDQIARTTEENRD